VFLSRSGQSCVSFEVLAHSLLTLQPWCLRPPGAGAFVWEGGQWDGHLASCPCACVCVCACCVCACALCTFGALYFDARCLIWINANFKFSFNAVVPTSNCLTDL